MVINIPINIDEDIMNKVIKEDYEMKLTNEMLKLIKSTLCDISPYGYGNRVEDGIKKLIDNHISKFIDENKEEILKITADELTEKLARTKRAKEVLEEALNES